MSTWLVTGAGGQDGSYLVDHARSLGHKVVCLSRATQIVSPRPSDLESVEWDFKSIDALCELLDAVKPARFFNFAAHSTGRGMFDDPVAISELNGVAVARILQAILNTDRSIRFCQASSSEMYGDPIESPQCENTAFRPQSPYAAAKLLGHSLANTFRTHHGLFACSAILFNHESPRRTADFVTRKISDGVARIKLGHIDKLRLETLNAQRDWGYAPDYVRAMTMMLDHEVPDDYVVATGKLHSVGEFCEVAFAHAGLDWRQWVVVDKNDPRGDTRRPRVGDARKLRETLGWEPSIDFESLVRLMVDASLKSVGPLEHT